MSICLIGCVTHEFHSLHEGQRPFHCGVSSPHSVQRNVSRVLAAPAMNGLMAVLQSRLERQAFARPRSRQ